MIMEGTKPIIIMEGTPPLRGVPSIIIILGFVPSLLLLMSGAICQKKAVFGKNHGALRAFCPN